MTTAVLPSPSGSGIAPVLLALTGGAALAGCQWLIFSFAPVAEGMGVIQKIFYLHLPLAWWSLISFFVVCAASVAYLATRRLFWDALAGAAAEVGVVLATLALASGCLWARRSWGVWWTADPRLTTTLIMWFVYVAYLVFRNLDLPRERRARLAAVIGIAAFLDVPLVFFSARLWRSIHPAVFAAEGGGMDGDMKIAVMATVAAFGLFWAGLLAFCCRLALLRATLDTLAARQLAEVA